MQNKVISIFTYMDRASSPFLKTWIQYYKKFTNTKPIILCRHTISGTTLKEYCDVTFVDVSTYFDSSRRGIYVAPNKIFADYQAKLLEESDVVLYADLDEFIVHSDLLGLLQSEFNTCLVTTGVEIVQDLQTETRFDFQRSINSQRGHMIYSEWYNKPLIINKQVDWCDGKHNHGKFQNYVEGLYLIHLGKVCLDLSKQYNRDDGNLYEQYSRYSHITPEEYANLLNNSSHLNHPITPIPEHIKTLVDCIL
jgi:hypothetical protein